ncbi:LamG-like jellyroll fold domain-containing protein [Mangrovimonas cancribranchiae]|uniref:LamG-like jellyroll fold domain-containing protein n=1 Tax=Mangrovimonas cancribranchiae TaxID=3080055 RepID=A0AAU6PAT5_9FLAO
MKNYTQQVSKYLLLISVLVFSSTAYSQYCNSSGNNDYYMSIGLVELNSINNSTGDGVTTTGYSDYTAISTDLDIGTTYTLNLEANKTNNYPVGFRVWIDWNGDDDFNDSGELAFSTGPSSIYSTSGNISVPLSAVSGSTRMRVIVRYNNLPSNCGTYNYGETEDYTVNLIASNPAQEIEITGNGNTINDGDITPDPTDNTDFGNVNYPGGSNNNIFIIENLGGSNDLNLTGSSPYVNISGTHAGDFTVTTIPASTIAAGNNTVFAIEFAPSALGLRSATVSIANDDSDENPYNFNIQGTGITPPPCGSTVLGNYSYEGGNQGWDTSDSNASRENYSSRAYSGNYSIRLREDGQAISPSFSLSDYDKVDLKFFFYASGMDSYETFYIDYRENNSASWQTVSEYRRGEYSTSLNKTGDFINNAFHSKTATLFKDDFSFPASATAQFRLRNDANGSSDYVYIDNITITGTTYCSPTNGPGGVASNLDLWLKANTVDGSTIAGDGTDVTFWADKGKGNHAETVEDFMAPVYMHNVNRNINFNPVVEFQNDNTTAWSDMTYINSDRQELKGTGGFNSSDAFIVAFPDPTITTSMIPLDTFTSTDPSGNTYNEDVTGFGYGAYSARVYNERLTYCLGTTGEDADVDEYPGTGFGRADTNSGTNYNQVGIVNFRENTINDNMELYFNANNVGNVDNEPEAYARVNNTRYWIGRSQYWDGSFDGRIAEIITYDSRKNDIDLTQERNRIQSYLGIKYGITLGSNGTSQDYVDSDGNVIWDADAENFNYDIAGIGRDDASELLQKQSRSVNNATATHSHTDLDDNYRSQGVLTMGLSQVYDTNHENITNNGTTFSDKQFLMWGNDGESLHGPQVTVQINMSEDISPALETEVEFNGIARTWKVVERGGDIPTVEVQILKNAIRTATPPDGRYLMFISDTPNFGPTADYRVMTETTNELGEATLTTDYDFDGTKYITFGWAPEVVYTRSIAFNGTTDYIDMEDALDLNSSEFTISAWVKRDTNSGNTSILSKRDASYTNGYDLKINNSGYAEMSWGNSGTQTITSNVIIPENQWHHIAVIYNSGNATMYIDGVESTSQSLSAPPNTNHSFYIGAAAKNTPEAFFHGNIDEVRVWDVALSLDELHFIMNQEILENSNFVEGAYFESRSITPTKNDVNTLPWNSLAGYYPMSTYTYTNTKDESGNGHQGALRHLRTVDKQTAPLPYQSTANGDWDTATTWTNGTVQTMPGANSIVDNSITVDWNIVETNHNVTMDNSSLASGNNGNRNVLALMIDSNELTVNGDNTSETGFGITISHYLNLDGKIDLEGESQLIQTLNSDLVVGTTGNLEKDQQGTRDLFTYNYWSSPVGVTTTANPNNYSYSLNSNILKDGTNSASPTNINFVGGYNGSSSSPVSIASYWLWKFGNLPSGDYSSWQHVRHTGTILAGEGFTMKGVANTNGNVSLEQNYVFDGKPNNGDINLTLNSGNDYLVGNPYPSAIDAEQFILDNGPTLDYTGSAPEGDALISGTLYFWEHWGGGSHVLAEYQGGYGTYNLAGGVPAAAWGTPDPDVAQVGTGTKTPGRYIPVGQGFFVTGDSTGDINFNNGQRVFQKEGTSASVFMRNDGANQQQATTVDNRMKLRIGFNSVNTIHRQLLVTVDARASQGFDWGFDGLTNEDQIDDMYWMLNDDKYTVQGIDTINQSTILPLGIHTDDNGLNNITIDILENVPDHLDIYAHDKELGIYHDLRESRYEFYLDAGEYLDRFEITFANQSLSTEDSLVNANNLQAHYSNNSQSIVIHNPKLVTVESVEMTTILGQKLFTFNNVETATLTTIKTQQLSTGTYIIQVNTNDNNTITKKVLVNN